MCTAITYQTKNFYFGRNLDLEHSYQEAVTVTPRNYPFHFRNGKRLDRHFAMIGVAAVRDGYPLYFDATNEKGLSMAGLNFPGNAYYFDADVNKENIAPFELIPWLLGQFSTVSEAETILRKTNLWNTAFHEQLPLSPLHWLLADRERCIVIESTKDGMFLHDDPYGVLTNNPPFNYHTHNLINYLNLTPMPPQNRFSGKVELQPYSLGMGSMGLPGDPSSPSRFVRAAFTKLNSISRDSEAESVSQFFHILKSVEQLRGITNVRAEEYEITRYSSCCNADKGIFYYTTYDNSQITAVDMHKEDLQLQELVIYPMITKQQILYQN